MRLVLTCLFCLCVAPEALAQQDIRSPDRYILTIEDPDARRRLETLLLAECLQVLDEKSLAQLRRLRREKGLPAYSVGWCIREGHMPWSLDGDWP
jgi:plasmid stabilization system protein ParE